VRLGVPVFLRRADDFRSRVKEAVFSMARAAIRVLSPADLFSIEPNPFSADLVVSVYFIREADIFMSCSIFQKYLPEFWGDAC
jgi:hypothetical protein